MPRGSEPGERRGGRQRGTPNRTTLARQELVERALSDGVSPLEFMLDLMRKPYPAGADAQTQVQMDGLRLDAAKACAPYAHPRLANIDAPISIRSLGGELADQGRVVLSALSEGSLTPSQAATVIQVIASQARIIEVDELERRIASLEEKDKP